MNQPQNTSTQKPELEHKDGPVKAAVWCNEGANGPFRTVKLSRIYKDPEGNWQRTQGFRVQDMPAVGRVADHINQQIAALA